MQKLNSLPNNDPGLSVTEAALQYIRRSLHKTESESPKAIGIRVGVKKAGCSGYEYILEAAFADSLKSLDYVFSFDDVSILIDKEIYLKFFKGGTILDFRKEGLKQGLQFENPNVAHQCGCGESFTLEDES
ncbi:iron-sulfur cluster assembly accessory protein [Candidatus Berkiella aquae]|uniref:Iron-binding protein IscA n=1 Tax=Candidatus Berkiella aquae TaxID=295108 RepID=A0A0Q9YMW9_9GAMM|nr:iron-sulfur cluster assembly accessory protein [Candidatus Berkiella aquae]MCS5711032.1 iron-sulfur cluster assembly accessory protein [Candidatus Berkiella aquae]